MYDCIDDVGYIEFANNTLSPFSLYLLCHTWIFWNLLYLLYTFFFNNIYLIHLFIKGNHAYYKKEVFNKIQLRVKKLLRKKYYC